MDNQKYATLWNKYRPVLLKLMLASEFEPQQYKLFLHEFQALNQRKKDFSFTLQAHEGKALNNIKASEVASDLLYILNMSRKATELMDQAGFEFTMDKHFLLQVNRLEASN